MSIRLTIAMPAFNEAGAIEKVVDEALAVLDDLDGTGEILVVDDGSTDRTPQILRTLAERDPRVRVVRNETNRGIRAFNQQMLQSARGEWVFYISSDGEFDPREALRFLDLATGQSLDAVLGYRTGKQYTIYRRIVSWTFNTLVWALFAVRFTDIGAVRLLRRSAYAPIRLYCRSAFINAERLLVGRRRGARFAELPVTHRKRLAGKGAGSRPAKVLAAFRELVTTRCRWLFFAHYYGDSVIRP